MLRHHSHTVGSIEYKGQKLPLIRLPGKWLERKGFKPGCKFEIFELIDSLVISLPWKGEEQEKHSEVKYVSLQERLEGRAYAILN